MRALTYLCRQIFPIAPANARHRAHAPLSVIALEARRVLDAAPVIDNQSFSIYESAPTDALIGYVAASDVDAGDGLVFEITAGNEDSLFKIDPLTGALRLNKSPAGSDIGAHALTVRVTDPAGNTDTATVTVNILDARNGQNDPPVILDQTFIIGAGAAVGQDVGTVTAYDPDPSETLTYSISGTEFSINATTGLIEVANAAAVVSPGKYVRTVTVADEDNVTDTAQITIIVNGPPTDIQVDNLSVDENAAGAVIGNVTVTDPNFAPPGTLDDTITFEITGDALNRFEIADGQLRLKSGVALNYEDGATISISIKATDRSGASFTEAFDIAVNDLNDAPTLVSLDNLDVQEEEVAAIIGKVTVTDEDDASFTYQILRETTPGVFVADARFEIDGSGNLKLVAGQSLDHETADFFTLRIIATDSGSLSAQGDFTIAVNDINEKPTDISVTPTSVAENAPGATVGTVVITDDDNPAEAFGQHTVTVLEDYGAGFVTSTRFEYSSGSLRLKAGVALDFETETSATVRIVADDGSGSPYSEDFVITVTNANDVPTDIGLSGTSILENVAGGTIGTVSVVDQDSSAGAFGQHTLIVQEDYGSGFVTSTRFEIVGGVLRLKAGVSLNHEADDSVTIRIVADDGSVPPYSENFEITVQDVNEAPTDISLSNASVNENSAGAAVGNVTVTDPDASNEPFGQHTLQVVEDYGSGFVVSTRFEIVGGQLRLKAGVALDHEAAAQVTVRIVAADGTVPAYAEDFAITVVDRNDLPVATNNAYSISSSSVLTGNVISDNTGSGVDTDQDGDTLSVHRVNDVITAGTTFVTLLGATVTVNANGTFSYDPTTSLALQQLKSGDSLADGFTYRLRDSQGGDSNTATVSILVSGLNDAPTVSPTATDAGVEDTATTYTFAQLLAEIGYADPDNPANTATILISDVQGGSLTLSGGSGGDGTTFRFTPTANSHAPITFKYQVVDADGEVSNVGQFTLTIRPVNDAPTLVIGNQLMNEDGSLVLPLSAFYSDVETTVANANFVLVSSSNSNVGINFNPAAGTATLVVTPNFNGIVTLVLRATDTGDGTDGQADQAPQAAETTFVITIVAVDDAPVAVDDAFQLNEDTRLGTAVGALLVNDSDVDSDPQLNQFIGPSGINANSFALVSGPQHAAAFVLNPDGSFGYQPLANYFGSDQFQYVIFDAQGIPSNIGTVALTVLPINDPPTFQVDPSFSLNPVLPAPQTIRGISAGPLEPDQTVTFSVSSADPAVLLAPSLAPIAGAPDQQRLIFAPAPFISRVTTITIVATDSEGLSTEQVVTVNLVVGQVPPANLAFEARQSLALPIARDAGIVADLSRNITVDFISELETSGSGGQTASRGERVVEVYLLDPATGQVVGEPQFTLPGKTLEQLNEIFSSLPDDQYRIVLRLEDGSRRKVLDVIVRDKQPFDPGDTQDEALVPYADAMAEPPIAPAAEATSAPAAEANPAEEVAPPPALPLTPPGVQQQETEAIKRAALPPAWMTAPALLAAAVAQRRRQQQAVQETLAQIGRQPWLLQRLRRPR